MPSSTNHCADISTVFLDRDGVINEKMPEGHYVRSVGELRMIRGVREAIRMLNLAQIRVLIVSNQRGVALGKMSVEAVNAIHREIQQHLHESGGHIDRFYICPHDRNSCMCRKPLPGLYVQAVIEVPDIDPQNSIMIGDSLSDIEFGRGIGMRTYLIRGDLKNRKPGWERAASLADRSFDDLSEAVQFLLHSSEMLGSNS